MQFLIQTTNFLKIMTKILFWSRISEFILKISKFISNSCITCVMIYINTLYVYIQFFSELYYLYSLYTDHLQTGIRLILEWIQYFCDFWELCALSYVFFKISKPRYQTPNLFPFDYTHMKKQAQNWSSPKRNPSKKHTQIFILDCTEKNTEVTLWLAINILFYK